MRESLPLRGEVRIRNRLVKSERFDVAAEFAQRVETFFGASARIAHQIVKALFTGNHDKMRYAARQPHPHQGAVELEEGRVDARAVAPDGDVGSPCSHHGVTR